MHPLVYRARNRCQIYTVRTSYCCMCRKPSTSSPHHQNTEVGRDESESRVTVRYALLVIYHRKVLGCNPVGRTVQYTHQYSKTSHGTEHQYDYTCRHSVFPHDQGYVGVF